VEEKVLIALLTINTSNSELPNIIKVINEEPLIEIPPVE
jgi:hypothetical protein